MTETKPRYTIVPNPEPITPLQSAMAKLADDTSKSTHLSPRECAAVVVNIESLQTQLIAKQDTIEMLMQIIRELAPERFVTVLDDELIKVWNE